jgi:hypothetical protein
VRGDLRGRERKGREGGRVGCYRERLAHGDGGVGRRHGDGRRISSGVGGGWWVGEKEGGAAAARDGGWRLPWDWDGSDLSLPKTGNQPSGAKPEGDFSLAAAASLPRPCGSASSLFAHYTLAILSISSPPFYKHFTSACFLHYQGGRGGGAPLITAKTKGWRNFLRRQV